MPLEEKRNNDITVFYEKLCPVCGKNFVYYPAVHLYQIRVGGHGGFTKVCSYYCVLSYERELDKKRKRAKKTILKRG